MVLTDYTKNQKITDSKIASTIIKMYGSELAEHIKKGYKYNLMLGALYIVRKKVLSKKPQCLSGQTKRLREATGNPNAIVYRTNEFYYSIYWTWNLAYKKIDFKLAKDVFRSLKHYEEYLELTAPMVELEKTKSGRTSSYVEIK